MPGNEVTKLTAELDITEGDVVVVTWVDTEDDCSWNKIKEIRTYRPPLAKHIGWFLNEDDLCVRILTGVVGTDGKVDNLQAGYSMIPKQSIVAVEKVRDDELEVLTEGVVRDEE